MTRFQSYCLLTVGLAFAATAAGCAGGAGPGTKRNDGGVEIAEAGANAPSSTTDGAALGPSSTSPSDGPPGAVDGSGAMDGPAFVAVDGPAGLDPAIVPMDGAFVASDAPTVPAPTDAAQDVPFVLVPADVAPATGVEAGPATADGPGFVPADASPSSNPDADSDTNAACIPGERRCVGAVPSLCDAAGGWQQLAACPHVCMGGSCTGTCTPGTSKCEGLLTYACDGSGAWQPQQTCPYLCRNGGCAGACVPATKKCEGTTPHECDMNGTWQGKATCPHVCIAGACEGECSPGAKKCESLVPYECDSQGRWQAKATCASSCSGGDCLSTSPRQGNWTGVYGSGEYGLSFVVDEMGRIKDLSITRLVPGPIGGNVPYEVTHAGPVVFAGDSFEFQTTSDWATRRNCGADNTCSNVTLRGAFSGGSAASGTFDSFFINYVNIGFGIVEGVAWQAAKDCTRAPSKGASASRFCAGTTPRPAELQIDPSSAQDFGTVPASTASTPRTFTIRNVGEVATTATPVASTAGSDFSVAAGTCTTVLAGGASCTVQVTFQPTTAGAKTSTLSVVAGALGPLTVNLTGTGGSPSPKPAELQIDPSTAQDFGSVPVGTASVPRTFTVKNVGDVATTGVPVASTLGPDFTVSNGTCTVALPGGGSCAVEVTFQPATPGPKASTLSVVAGALGPLTVSLTGIAGGPSVITVAPIAKSFMARPVGTESAEEIFTVSNPVGGSTTGTPMVVLSNTAAFSVKTNTCTSGIAGGSSCTVGIVFKPTTVGFHFSMLTISASPGGMATVVLSGQAASGLAISPNPHDFMNVAVAQVSPTVTFTLSNFGSGSLGPLSMVVSGPNAGEFGLENAVCNGSVVTAGGTCTFGVRFAPFSTGAKVATVIVTAPGGETAVVGVVGTGVAFVP